MPNVLHVSIVLLAVALKARVTAKPHPLKRAMLSEMATLLQSTALLPVIWRQPVTMSKYPPRPEGVAP